MTLEDQIKQAFFTLVERENGNLRQISLQKGADYSTIHNLHSGKSAFSKMSVRTLGKLFPMMRVSFFGEPASGITVHGNNTGAIAQGKNATAEVDCLQQFSETVDKRMLESQILHEESFSDSERIKFLLFLKDKVK